MRLDLSPAGQRKSVCFSRSKEEDDGRSISKSISPLAGLEDSVVGKCFNSFVYLSDELGEQIKVENCKFPSQSVVIEFNRVSGIINPEKKRKFSSLEDGTGSRLEAPPVMDCSTKRKRGMGDGQNEMKLMSFSRKRKDPNFAQPPAKVQRFLDLMEKTEDQKAFDVVFATILTIWVCFWPDSFFLQQVLWDKERRENCLAPQLMTNDVQMSRAWLHVFFSFPSCPPCRRHEGNNFLGPTSLTKSKQSRVHVSFHLCATETGKLQSGGNKDEVFFRKGIGWHMFGKLSSVLTQQQLRWVFIKGDLHDILFGGGIGWEVPFKPPWWMVGYLKTNIRKYSQANSDQSTSVVIMAKLYHPRTTPRNGVLNSITEWACRGGVGANVFHYESISARPLTSTTSSSAPTKDQAGTATGQPRLAI